MRYREHRLGPPLGRLIECVWFITSDDGRVDRSPQRVMPDGCIELVFHFDAPFALVSATGVPEPQADSFLVGMMTRPLVIEPPRAIDTMGIRFRPGGAHPFIGVPLSELTDRSVPLGELWRRSIASELGERLAAARDDDARVVIAIETLTNRMRTGVNTAIGRAIDRCVRTAGRASIAALARDAGVSRRHLERRFAEQVGVGPKLLSRILRFQNTLRQRTPDRPIEWARVAVECGYTDQAHLIRDYGQFAGETPRRLASAEGELSSYFTAPQRLAALFAARL